VYTDTCLYIMQTLTYLTVKFISWRVTRDVIVYYHDVFNINCRAVCRCTIQLSKGKYWHLPYSGHCVVAKHGCLRRCQWVQHFGVVWLYEVCLKVVSSGYYMKPNEITRMHNIGRSIKRLVFFLGNIYLNRIAYINSKNEYLNWANG